MHPVITRALVLILIVTALPVFGQRRRPNEYAMLVREYARQQDFSGAVLVAKGDEILYRGGAGMANREWSVRNTADTRFRLGSITKQFTAAVILQLVAEGKIELQAPITRYLTDYRKDTGDRITIHHLLTHTSGIPSYTSRPDFSTIVRDHSTPAAFVAERCSGDLEFEPGERFRYNNSGYFILGAIIEAVTGRRYEIELEERIFRPLGMDASGHDNHRSIIAKRAAGHDRIGGVVINCDFLDLAIPYAAGSLYSTVEDLRKWDLALYGNDVLDEARREIMFGKHVETGRSHYGYGWMVGEREIAGEKVLTHSHGGGIFGFSTMIMRFPETRGLVIVLSNLPRPGAGGLAQHLARLLHGDDEREVRRPPIAAFFKRLHGGDLHGADVLWKRSVADRGEESVVRAVASLRDSAKTLLEGGHFDEAAAILGFLLRQNPEDADAEKRLATVARSGRTGPQFVEQLELLPGPIVWTEGVHPVDVNGDGRLDLLFVNCNGWRRPGDMSAPSADPLAPTLLINEGSEDGRPQFADRTADYFPEDFKIHGKNAVVCDLDGDGHVDLAFAVAFGGQQRLLRFDPSGKRFVDETEQRLGELKLNANGIGWGDVDDDGDADLVFTDSGPNSDRAPGGKAVLMLNDGQGRFTAAGPDRFPSTEKVGAQNAKILDIDGDLDLDIVIDGKSRRTQLYLNDGAGRFTASDAIPEAAQGGQPYEIEWADMDGDGDFDAVHMSWGGDRRQRYRNVVLENTIAPDGKLGFKVHQSALDGRNNEDENEFAFLDADDDGDLDLVVATLLASPGDEKLFENSGRFGRGFLKQKPGAFSDFIDGTLDLCVADFDGDGRYDIVTGQGESDRFENFRNRYYRNTGPKDTRAPKVVRQAWNGRVVRAQIQDATQDDMTSFVSATVHYTVNGKQHVGIMGHAGGHIHRYAVPSDLAPAGATVTYSIEVRDIVGNVGRSKERSQRLR